VAFGFNQQQRFTALESEMRSEEAFRTQGRRKTLVRIGSIGRIGMQRGIRMAHAKLKLLKEKQAALIARIKQEENKVRAKERKSDTRRKVLAGAAALEWAKRDNDFAKKLDAELKAFLVRDADRELFGLPIKNNGGGQASPNQAA
jgi:hypothetical protein